MAGWCVTLKRVEPEVEGDRWRLLSAVSKWGEASRRPGDGLHIEAVSERRKVGELSE